MIEPATSPKASAQAAPVLPRYPMPWVVGMRLAWSILWRKQRSFRLDARLSISLLAPSMQVLGSENIPLQGPCLVTANHWSRAGFQGWWIPFAISACMPFEMHWVMTNAWRFEGHAFAAQLEKLSRWGFRRVPHTYGFTSMPSMPPRDAETQARSQAVRHLLRYAREHDSPVIGLAPEGYNMPGGLLGHPPAGVGRLIVHLIPYTQRIIPVAVFETQERLCLRIGEAYTIEKPIRAEPEIIDRLTSDTVMQAIAQLLPFHLRGAYS